MMMMTTMMVIKRLSMEGKGNVVFNNALNTFFIYGYMASDIW